MHGRMYACVCAHASEAYVCVDKERHMTGRMIQYES